MSLQTIGHERADELRGRSIQLQLEWRVAMTVRPSQRACEAAAMFGIAVGERRTVEIVPPLTLRLAVGRVVFITGASGGGKSTLLRLVRRELRRRPDAHVMDLAEDGPDGADADTAERRPLVEAIGGTLEQAVRRLALAGLSDAQLMLRRPAELSDGQRHRWRLARIIDAAERDALNARCESRHAEPPLSVILADEFAATLDRRTAVIVARHAARWARRSGVCLLIASSHDDLLEPLSPDVLIVQHPGRRIEVMEAADRDAERRAANGNGQMTND